MAKKTKEEVRAEFRQKQVQDAVQRLRALLEKVPHGGVVVQEAGDRLEKALEISDELLAGMASVIAAAENGNAQFAARQAVQRELDELRKEYRTYRQGVLDANGGGMQQRGHARCFACGS